MRMYSYNLVYLMFNITVFAINGLYTALGSPTVPGWVTNGGDPCTENWQGVGCAESNITAMYDELLCAAVLYSVIFIIWLCKRIMCHVSVQNSQWYEFGWTAG
jgi:hypothetical protein